MASLKTEWSSTRLKDYFWAEVTTRHADILLLLCCLISGLVDSTVYNGMITEDLRRGALQMAH